MAEKKPDITRTFPISGIDLQLARKLIYFKQDEKTKKATYEQAEGKRKNTEFMLKRSVDGLEDVPGVCPILLVDAETGESVVQFGKARSTTEVNVMCFISRILEEVGGVKAGNIQKIVEAFEAVQLHKILALNTTLAKELYESTYNTCSFTEHSGARQMKAFVTVTKEEADGNG